jgi:hypothetical protein
MYQLNEPLTFTVPLSFEAHGLADRFRRQQSSTQKAKQVYLNTLAVYAVDFYLRCSDIETEVDKSASRNPLDLKFMDVADLQVKSIGKLECLPVLPDSTVMQVPIEVRDDRVGYVAVQFERSLKQATILGFTPNAVAELPLSQLRSLEEFPEFLSQLRHRTRINLRQWFKRIFEPGWQEIEALLSPQQLEPAFSMRGESAERGKLIDFPSTQQAVVLILTMSAISEQKADIRVEVRAAGGYASLPENLAVKVIDKNQKTVMQAITDKDNQNLRFEFKGEFGEQFDVQMTLQDIHVTEEFVIGNKLSSNGSCQQSWRRRVKEKILMSPHGIRKGCNN